MVIDRDYSIIEANKAVLRRHGKRRKEVIGRYCHDISHGLLDRCQPPYHECPIKAVWETSKPARAINAHLRAAEYGLS